MNTCTGSLIVDRYEKQSVMIENTKLTVETIPKTKKIRLMFKNLGSKEDRLDIIRYELYLNRKKE